MKKKLILLLVFVICLLILMKFSKNEPEDNFPIFSTIIKLHKSLITNTYYLYNSYINNTKEVFNEENKVAKITVHYIDTLGNNIHEDIIYNKEFGQYYETNSISISGYVLVEAIGEEVGVIKENNIEVTFIYEKL